MTDDEQDENGDSNVNVDDDTVMIPDQKMKGNKCIIFVRLEVDSMQAHERDFSMVEFCSNKTW